jgi:hypothetical protein
MLRRAAIAAFLLLPAAARGADDLPAWVLLLSRIKRHMREELARLPDYTCLETMQRYRRVPGGKPPLKQLDTVLLEVLYAGDKELYGSPGARNFPNTDPSAFTGGGLSGTGMFGLHLNTLFVNENANIQYRGEEQLAGRRAARFDYRVPLMLSGFTIHLVDGRGQVSTRGSFWSDPVTYDLLRLDVQVEDIPPSLPLISSTQSIEYARTRIGEREVMLPQSAVLDMLQTSGEESRNLLEFTHCRSFAAESRISFDAAPPDPSSSPATPARPSSEPPPLAAGLTVTVELTSRLDERAAVGSLVEARTASNVVEKGKVVVPAGAVVRGRIRRLEHYSDSGEYFTVGLEFTELETAAGPVRFYANLLSIDESGRVKLMLVRGLPDGPRQSGRREEIWANYLPGVASFFVTGARLDLPRGFRTVWKTKAAR